MSLFTRIYKNSSITFDELHELMAGEEPKANLSVARILMLVVTMYLFTWFLFKVGLLHSVQGVLDVVFLGGSLLLAIVIAACYALQGEGQWLKFALIGFLTVSILPISLITGHKVWMLYAIPIILSGRYVNVWFVIINGFICLVFVFLTGLCNVYVSPYLGIVDLNTVSFNEYTVLETTSMLHNAVISAGVGSDELLRGTLFLAILPNTLMVICVTAARAASTFQGQKLMMAAAEKAREASALALEVEKDRSQLMVSQIQPHFLYNTLTAIMAIDGNPDETVDAIGDFGKYLRENLNSLSANNMIPFSKEIAHVKRYASLEQLRFSEKLDIRYDIETESFSIPVFSLQVLVENAIKHGISASEEGGWIIVETREAVGEWTVTVRDNGLGFDPSTPIDETTHIGLANVRKRLELMSNGSLDIVSAPGEGTAATIHIPKQSA